MEGMSSSSTPRSVKIGENERGGWTSERPRRPGEPERPPRLADVSVRGRVLAPSDRLRYSPGSLLLIVGADEETREAFAARVLEENGVLLSIPKLRAMLAGRVDEDQVEAKAGELLDSAAQKRLAAGQTVVITTSGLDPAERERYVRMAAPHRRPRHLLLLEAGKETVADEDRTALGELRTALDSGALGQEGFATSLRLGGRLLPELKKIVFAPPPADG